MKKQKLNKKEQVRVIHALYQQEIDKAYSKGLKAGLAFTRPIPPLKGNEKLPDNPDYPPKGTYYYFEPEIDKFNGLVRVIERD